MAKKKKGGKKLTLRDKAKWLKKQIKKEATKRELSTFEKKRLLEKNATKNAKNMTKPEKAFVKLMKELDIKCESQKIISGYIYDFYLPDYKMVVEIDGDYYHGNPDKYSKDQLNGMQKKNIANDKEKTIAAKGLGYKLERIWETDINKKYSDVKKRFKKILLNE